MECPKDRTKLGGRQIGPHVDFALLASWLKFCIKHHTKLCQPNASNVASLPGFRVIDCDSREVVPWDRLPPSAEFTALSYVWGGVGGNCALAEFRLPSDIPLLIDDAIEVTRRLSYRYLWVDRYCIPQDNDSDKHTQIQRMNLIYGSAAVTIIAAAGDDPRYGIPGVSLRPRKKQAVVHVGSRTLVSVDLNIRSQVKASKWHSRGWTYQEAYLSTRRLVFTDHMVYFQCCAMHCHETVSAPLEQLHTDSLQRFRDAVCIARLWPLRGLGKYPADLGDRIAEYSGKQLSVASDALCAFEGILARFATMEPSVHAIWGVPVYNAQEITTSLSVGLSWCLAPSRWLGDWREAPRLSRRQGFPSWSWAGWVLNDGKCDFSLSFQPRFSPDKSTLSGAEGLVEIDMQCQDGEILSWRCHSDRMLRMGSQLKPAPEILHISGLTYDCELRVPRSGWADRYYEPRPCSCGGNPEEISAIKAALTRSVEYSPADLSEQVFSIRIVALYLLKQKDTSRTQVGEIMQLVLHRPTGSSLWERLMIGSCACGRFFSSTNRVLCSCAEAVRLHLRLRVRSSIEGEHAARERAYKISQLPWKWRTSVVG